jgi:hypothetical protein
MTVRHDVVVLEPEALERGVLLAQVLLVPRDGIWIESVGNFADIGIDYRDATVPTPITIARQHSRSYFIRSIFILTGLPDVPQWIAFRFRYFVRVTGGVPDSDI